MKQAIYILFFLTTVISCQPRLENKERVISEALRNTEYRELTEEIEEFSGFEDYEGALICDKENKIRALTHIKQGNHHIILLVKVNAGDNPTSQIIDTLHFKSESDKYCTELLLECEDSHNTETRLIYGFYYYDEEKEIFEDILDAFKVDLESDKLIRIDTSGIRCYNVGFGA